MDCYEVTLNVWTGNTPAENSMKNGAENKEKNDGIHTVTERNYLNRR